MPWMIRNYRLTNTLIPTSVHGGAQLWYGTLQVGPYLNSRGYNPRSVFEARAFEYTSLDAVPLIVQGELNSCATRDRNAGLSLIYWTDADDAGDATRYHRLAPASFADSGAFTFEIPPPTRDTVYYYYFDVTLNSPSGTTSVATPASGGAAPFVYFVSQNHLGDLDRHGDLLDIFDVIRLARHDAWNEPLPFADKLERAGVTGVPAVVATLLDTLSDDTHPPIHVEHDDHAIRIAIGAQFEHHDSARLERTHHRRHPARTPRRRADAGAPLARVGGPFETARAAGRRAVRSDRRNRDQSRLLP